jgi:hypothetical protein
MILVLIRITEFGESVNEKLVEYVSLGIPDHLWSKVKTGMHSLYSACSDSNQDR